jgi:surface protein
MHEGDTMPLTIEDDVLVAYQGVDEVVTVPADVRAIGEGAFRGNQHVQKVQMDANVFWIMQEAFMDCASLKFVTLHDALDEIGDRAFKGCQSLRDVDQALEDAGCYGLTRIGDEAFAGCASLKKLEYDSGWWLTVGRRAFADCTGLTLVMLPDGLAELEDDAFEGCTSLKYVSMPRTFQESVSQRRTFEEAARAIRDRCPNIVAIEGRRRASGTWSETEPPWSTGTLAQAIFSLKHQSMSYEDVADRWHSGDTVGLFKGYTELRHLDLTGFDTSGEKSLACLFKGCAMLHAIDLSPLDTSAVEDMRQMFFGCRSLEEVDLSCLDTSQVQTMAHLFHNCHALRRASLRGLDLSRVKSLWSAFDHCESLEDLDLTVSAMPPLEKTGYLFRACTSIKRWKVSEAWPARHDTIPAPTSKCGMWWSMREQRWMTVDQIVERGLASDVFTSAPSEVTNELSSIRHA